MGSIIEKEKGKVFIVGLQTEQSIMPKKYRFVEDAMTLLGKTDEKIIVPLAEMYKQYENIVTFGNDIIILQQKRFQTSEYLDNRYPLLSYFRPYPVVNDQYQIEMQEEISKKVKIKEMFKSKKQVIFCIKQLRDNSYLRSFMNACEFYQIQLLIYDEIHQIPASYLFFHDMILGFQEAKILGIQREGHQKKKNHGNVYFFCSKQLKRDLDQCQHIKVKQIKKKLNKIEFPFSIETNILEIIEKILTSGMNPYQKMKKRYPEHERQRYLDFRGLDSYFNIFVCVREKSQDDYAVFVALKKIQNTYQMIKVRKIYAPANDFSVSMQNLKTKDDPFEQFVGACSFSLVVVGKSIKSFHAVSGLIEKNGLDNRVVLLRKNQTENIEDFKDKTVRMLQKNELPRIFHKIPLKVVVLGTIEFFLKIAYELPLFDIKLFLDQNQIILQSVQDVGMRLQKMNNQIVVLNSQAWEKFLSKLEKGTLKVQIICFDTRENISTKIKESKVPYCSNQSQFVDVTVKLVKKNRQKNENFPLSMQGNYHHRKMTIISNHCQQIFSDLKVKHQILESHSSSDIFLFECQKWVQFDISQSLIPTLMTLYTSNFDFPQITFRIKQKLIEELFYLRKLGNLPELVIQQLIQKHHNSTQELSIHLAKLFCEHPRFRRVTNRIFTQILYQNKKQFIEYMPYLFFVLFFCFGKSCSYENYLLAKSHIKIISNDVTFENVKKFLKTENKSLYTTEFLLGQIYDKPIQENKKQNIYLIEIQGQLLNQFSHFFPFFYYREKKMMLIPPLTKLQNYCKNEKIFLNVIPPQEQTFMTYFFRIVYNDNLLQRISSNSINSLHKMMDLFRNKKQFSLEAEFFAFNKYLSSEYVGSLNSLNKIYQGKYTRAEMVLTQMNKTSKVLKKYIQMEREKIHLYFNKTSSMKKKKKKVLKEGWISQYDEENERFIIKNINQSATTLIHLKNKKIPLISSGQTEIFIDKNDLESEDVMPLFNEVLQHFLSNTIQGKKNQQMNNASKGLANFFQNFLNTSNMTINSQNTLNREREQMQMYDEENQKVFIFSNPFQESSENIDNGSQKKIIQKKSVKFLPNQIYKEPAQKLKNQLSQDQISSSFGTKTSIPNEIPRSMIISNRKKYP